MGLTTTSLFVIYHDLSERKIPNNIVWLLMVLGIGSLGQSNQYERLLVALFILIIGIVLSNFNVLGGGDSKLLAAFSLFISVQYMPLVMAIILLLGGGLAAFYWLMYEVTQDRSWLERGVPYALPICVGSLLGIAASL